MFSDNPIVNLTEDECREVLQRNTFGRLAVAVAGTPEIMPINYVADGDKLYFRTAEGSKLAALTINSDVAFETDEIGTEEAVSVIVQGQARELRTPEEQEFAESLKLRPWIDTRKSHVIEITPGEVTGRRFRLNENAAG